MKYQISPQISAILLAAAADGILNLDHLSPKATAAPPICYAECARSADGTITWNSHHLPIIDPYVWDRYQAATFREPAILLTKAEKASIIKACMYGETDGESLSRIFPIERKPVMAAILYQGFNRDDKMKPQMPESMMREYSTIIHPSDSDFGICASFIDNPSEYPPCQMDDPIDLSNGERIDQEKAPLFDMLSTGLVFFCR